MLLILNHYYFRFKHNTSFVSRFSTIRKHRSQGNPSQSSLTRGRTDSTAFTDFVGTSSKAPSGSTNFVDETVKDVSDTSKRNSDGKISLFYSFIGRVVYFKLCLINLFNIFVTTHPVQTCIIYTCYILYFYFYSFSF